MITFNNNTNIQFFKTGDVVKIYFLQRLSKFRRIFSFIGLCTNFNKKTKNFTLQNFYGNEFVRLTLPVFSPNLFKLSVLTSYNFKFKKSKLYNYKKMHLFSKTDLLSPPSPPPVSYQLQKYVYQSGNLRTKEKKRLRNKFRV